MSINVFDIETFEEGGKVVPYCICFILEGVVYTVYYVEGELLVLTAIYKICSVSKRSFIEVYVHNLNFDAMLILDAICYKKML